MNNVDRSPSPIGSPSPERELPAFVPLEVASDAAEPPRGSNFYYDIRRYLSRDVLSESVIR